MPKILVADDNANIQKMVALAFEERGIQVVSVGNGEAAVRRIPDLNPDLVLADIFMPVRNGYEVCEFVKKDERFSHVPVILLVGAFDPLDEKEARRVGADGVLKKPFVPPDPLIAMVTSALEKNPRVAAEMAKAREAKLAPPEPAPVMEVPTRAEPKPLPDFPEPSPEEAAMVYGFGKGVRALDDEPAAVAAGPKPPVAAKEEADDEDDFDAAATTTSDWRRNAMDFEVPAESANMPAFADEHLESADFPSESDYPPRRVRVPEPVEESDPVVQDSTPPPAPRFAPVVAESHVVRSTVAESSAVESTVMESATVVSASSESSSAPADEPAPSKSLWAKLWGKLEHEPVRETQDAPADEPRPVHANWAKSVPESAPEARELPVPYSESQPEPGAPAATPHWMDALAPSQMNSTGGGWMSSIAMPPSESKPVSYPAKEPIESREQAASPVEVEAAEPVEVHDEIHDEVRDEVHDEVWPEGPAEDHAHIEAPEPQDLFPVSHAVHEDSPVAEAHSEPEEKPVLAHSEAESAETWFAPTPSVFDHVPDPVSETVPVAHTEPDQALELDGEASNMKVGLRDPNLVESPAVRVTPEPLLVDNDEDSRRPSEYNSRSQDVPALHSYFAPASGNPAVEEPAAAEEPSVSAREEMQVPSFDPPASEEADERIPTGPPPNREALSSIPFLTPPPDFRASMPAREPAAANQGTIDEVVRKVLERLEPQIHDLLSRGVLKPLVESLLQTELAKKDK